MITIPSPPFVLDVEELFPPYPIMALEGTLVPPLAPPPPANNSFGVLIDTSKPAPPFCIDVKDNDVSPDEPIPPPPPAANSNV